MKQNVLCVDFRELAIMEDCMKPEGTFTQKLNSDDYNSPALQADVHPQTARKYIQAAQPPGQLQKPHPWRTGPDPLERIWPEVVAMLRDAPE